MKSKWSTTFLVVPIESNEISAKVVLCRRAWSVRTEIRVVFLQSDPGPKFTSSEFCLVFARISTVFQLSAATITRPVNPNNSSDRIRTILKIEETYISAMFDRWIFFTYRRDDLETRLQSLRTS